MANKVEGGYTLVVAFGDLSIKDLKNETPSH